MPKQMAEKTQDFSKLARPDGHIVAYRSEPGRGPAVVFCGGFRSDMTGTKATALAAWAARAGRALVRFDYFGHGASSGRFEDGTIGRWAQDTIAVLDQLVVGKAILIGSSMGGWLALLAARARAERVAGLIGIAAACDFTEELMWKNMSEAERARLLGEGRLVRPSAYLDDPTIITRALIEEGRRHLLLGGKLEFPFPVHLLHGLKDPDVPWQHSQRLFEHLTAPDLALTLIKDGDHRLSTPADIARLIAAVEAMGGTP